MRSFRFAFLLLLLSTCFAVGASRDSEQIKFPTENPAFNFVLPSGWTHNTDDTGNLSCDPADESGYTFTLLPWDVTTERKLKAQLPEILETFADGAKVKDLERGEVESTKNKNGVRFTGIRGTGTSSGIDFNFQVQGLEAQKGKFYVIMTSCLKQSADQHEKDYAAIYNSINPTDTTDDSATPAAGKIPSNAELTALLKGTLTSISAAVQKQDFNAFYKSISTLWQEQTTPEKLAELLKTTDEEAKAASAKMFAEAVALQPTFDPKPTIGEHSELIVNATYALESPLKIAASYLQEGGVWKLFSVSLHGRRAPDGTDNSF